MHLDEHLDTECPMAKVKCDKCDQEDFRAQFLSGEHDCISLLKSAIQ